MSSQAPLSIVFSGGGCRAFWSLGVYRAIADKLPPLKELAGVSAGSAMSLGVASGTVDHMIEVFKDRTGKNARNIYPERWLIGKRAFPHEDMYRGTILDCVVGDAWDTMLSGPPVRILQAYVAAGRPVWRTTWRAVSQYRQRRKAGEVHGPLTPYDGIVEEVDSSHNATVPGDLADYVLKSSTSPPVTSIPREDGKMYLDGSLVDAVPLRALTPEAQAGRVMILLTRCYPEGKLPQKENHLYLMPSVPPPIHKWDYTSPAAIQLALDAGERDATAQLARIEAFLSGS